jgi:hypothetical protein
LFLITPTVTRFLSAAGALTSAEDWDATDIVWQEIDLAAASGDGAIEGATLTYSERTAAKHGNVMQIFKYGFQTSYSTLGADGQIAAPGTSVDDQVAGKERPLRGSQQISAQTQLKLKQLALDYNWSMLGNTYNRPTDNAAARKMRGMSAVVDLVGGGTNVVAAGSTSFTASMLQELIREMANLATFEDPWLFVDAATAQNISKEYAVAPRDRTVGGVALDTILEDIAGRITVAYERHLPSGEALLVDMAHISPKVMPIPGKGGVFVEEKASTTDSMQFMLYGELSYSYGLPEYHGKITGLV